MLHIFYLGHHSRLLIATILHIKAVVVRIIFATVDFELSQSKDRRVRHSSFFKGTILHIPSPQ